ncbi:unnamed protein product [Symbiodinium sp. KB8]|nr:unnamed protein product [Symbiodinium sp. KB8]
MLDRIMLDVAMDVEKDDAPVSRDVLSPSPAGDMAVKDHAKPSTEEEDDILMDAFVHPLLERFSVCKDDMPAPGVLCVRVDTIARREGAALRRTAGKLEVSPAECNQANSLSDLLVAMSQAYKALLDAFLDSSDAYKGLRLPLLPVTTRHGQFIKRAQTAKPFWSAVALALAQLSSRQLAALKEQCVEVVPGSADGSRGSLEEVLGAKVDSGKSLTIDAKRSRLPMRKEGYGWCRRDNDGDARLWRLEAFVLTQRAVWARGFRMAPDKEVSFDNFHQMLCGTKVFTPAAAIPAEGPPSLNFEVQTLQELHLEVGDVGETVMEVAGHFMKQGCRVAAVNAASAYQVGGGASTGGRHALEEAWCISSTLYQSLASVEPQKTGGLPGYRQHIPVAGCIVSPHVEVFREPTDDGYGFLDAPQPLTGVVSVAMFNRNPRVRDSPLDSPERPAEYLKQTRQKLEAALLASVEVLNAEIIIVPDVGCGVFGNDPYIIGGCLGSVLRRHSQAMQTVKKVVLTGRREDFSDACLRALQGKDPRPLCPDSGAGAHAARYRSAATAEGDASDPSVVDEALLQLALHPPEQDERSKHPCRYGASCHIRTPDHLARFSHPETGPGPSRPTGPTGVSGAGTSAARGLPATGSREPSGASGAAGRTTLGTKVVPARPRSAHDKPSDPTPTGTSVLAELPSDVRRAETPNPDITNPVVEDAGGSTSSRSGRPVCRYGEACYNNNPKHLAEFSHPWLDGETERQAQARRDQQDCHDLLNKAKAGTWEQVQSGLIRNPRLLDMRPESRKFALIHYAAFQFHLGALDMLLKLGADPNLKNQDGKTALELLNSERKALPIHDVKHQKMAQDCLLRLRRYDTPASRPPLSKGI